MLPFHGEGAAVIVTDVDEVRDTPTVEVRWVIMKAATHSLRRLERYRNSLFRREATTADIEHTPDAPRMRPWNMTVGIAIGLVIGAVLSWGSYVPSEGMFQNPQLVIVPAAIGILIVNNRNRRKQVGQYDPKVVAGNKRGRV